MIIKVQFIVDLVWKNNQLRSNLAESLGIRYGRVNTCGNY